MKKKLILSSILTPIIPAAALVSCGNGIAELNQLIVKSDHFTIYARDCKILDPKINHTKFDFNLSLSSNVLNDDCYTKDVKYIVLYRAYLFDTEVAEEPIYFYPGTSIVNKIMFNDKELKEGDESTQEDCWYFADTPVEEDVDRLHIHLNDWKSPEWKLTLSLSLDVYVVEEQNSNDRYFMPSLKFCEYL